MMCVMIEGNSERTDAMARVWMIVFACAAVVCFGQLCMAADAPKAPEKTKVENTTGTAAQPSEDRAAAFMRTIEKRTSEAMKMLDIKDEAKARKVHDVMIAQYLFVNDWHEKNDAVVKPLAKKNDDASKAEIEKLKAPLKAQHEKFVGELAANLTPDQIEKVKNYIVKDKLPVTYGAYCDMLPKLTEEQKAKILDILKQGREEAMDAGSAEEKTAIFGRYKGKVNIYLSSQGINMKEAEKEWKERRDARKNSGAANPGQVTEKKSEPAADEKK
jgi:hypothetical protein